MGDTDQKSGGDVFIVDNSDQDWKVRRYLHDWAHFAHTLEHSPPAYFEIGGLLALDGQWQKVDKFRILIGDDVWPLALIAIVSIFRRSPYYYRLR